MNRRKFIAAFAAILPGVALAQAEDDVDDFTPLDPPPDDSEDERRVWYYCGDSYGNWWKLGDTEWVKTDVSTVLGDVINVKNRER